MSCRHLDRCAGCPLMHLPKEGQLAAKQARLSLALRRHPALAEVEIPPVIEATPALGYRTRLKWMVQGGRLGMFESGKDHRVVDTPDCLVASPTLLAIAGWIREQGQALGLEAVDLREVEAGTTRRALVTLVVPTLGDEARLRAFASSLVAAHPEVAGVAVNVRGRRNPQVLGSDTRLLVGERDVRDRVGRAYAYATFGAFVQAHRMQARAITARLIDRVATLGERPRVLELFGGAGAFGLELAATGATVDSVEAFAPAAALASRAAKEQGLSLVAHADDAERYIERAVEENRRYDAVVVDPPRRGLTPKLRAALAKLDPTLVAYVSCHPETLARDLDHLATLGFGVESLAAFDMIPQTDEVESLVMLVPGPARRVDVLHRDDAGMLVERRPHVSLGDLERTARVDLGAVASVFPRDRVAVSGVAWVWRGGAGRPTLERRVLVAVKGLTTTRGEIDGAPFRRLGLAGGHSLLELTLRDAALDRALAALAADGHPVLGGPGCDPATTRFMLERHGLERPWAHVTHVKLEGGAAAASPVAGDLVAMLASLGLPSDLVSG
jgi:23S rRNA (uracil1939-C5)-methyltransferase